MGDSGQARLDGVTIKKRYLSYMCTDNRMMLYDL
jgi:hypothetical protein